VFHPSWGEGAIPRAKINPFVGYKAGPFTRYNHKSFSGTRMDMRLNSAVGFYLNHMEAQGWVNLA